MSLKLTADCRICGKFRVVESAKFICAECHGNLPEIMARRERRQRYVFLVALLVMIVLGAVRCVYVAF